MRKNAALFPCKNDGKLLETAMQKALTDYCQTHPVLFHRFYDTHAARNWLPAQPGDFLLVVQGRAILIECKSTITGAHLNKLARGNAAQIGKHKLWLRAGGLSRYVYLNIQTNELILVDGRNITDKKAIIPTLFSGTLACMSDLVHVLATII